MTVRRLILMRHAKSSWKEAGMSDHDRPLNGRGRRDAPLMAAELSDRDWAPDAAVSSTAQRTRETWGLLAPTFDVERVLFSESLYLAGLEEIIEHAADWPDGWGTVIVLGHNPGWSHAASRLSRQPIEMTTANCALLTGEGDTWGEAFRSPWALDALLRPREPRG
ncbi:MAG: histidine phosphatase family protein [Deltaproteobacteria bacterium]|nr:histidine phosphatase family protein [Deltaproteobacteria bacterium]